MKNNRDSLYIGHILDAIENIESFIEGKSIDNFSNDKMFQSAVIHQLMVIGEAANKVSKSFQEANPDIPWKEIVGMRNKLIHDYFEIDPEEVWKTINEDIPMLKDMLFKNKLT